jgi:hypothetical protein
MHLSLAAIVVDEYDPAIDFFVGTLGVRARGGLAVADE